MKTMAEIRAARADAVFHNKLAAVEAALGTDPEVVGTLHQSVEIIKEAHAEITDPCEILDLATQMTVDHLGLGGDTVKTASAEEIEDAFDLGFALADVAFASGVTVDDIEKVASDEEADMLGKILVQALARAEEQE